MIYNLGNPAEDPDVIRIPPVTAADWGTPSGSITAGTGAPVGDLGAQFYFDLNNFNLYEWTGSVWTGPHPFNYSTETPDSADVGGPDYWVVGSNFQVTGGIYGPRVLVTIPSNGDLIIYDGSTNSWAATDQDNAIGGYVSFRLDQLIDAAPSTLNTLNELAAALNDDANFASTVASELGNKADLDEANAFVVGGHSISAATASEVPLVVRGATGQTANLLEAKTVGNVNRFSVSDAGFVSTENVQAGGGVRVGTAVSFTTNQRWVSIGDAASAPSAVTSGAIVYAESGELRARSALANVGLTAKRVAVKTGAHTFEGADQGAIVVLNDSSNHNFTIPEDASVNFPVGTVILVATQSTGHIDIVGSGAATVAGTTTLNTAGQVATLIKIAANTWLAHH